MRLIDADALIERLKPYIDKYGAKKFPYNMVHEAFIYEVEQEPTVDAVPVKHGRFIGTEYDGYADGSPVYYEWKCSECGCIFEDDEPTYNYCPNCGARMDEE